MGRVESAYGEARPFPRRDRTEAEKDRGKGMLRVCPYTGEVVEEGELGQVDHVCEIEVWHLLMTAASKALGYRGARLAWPEEARAACEEVANSCDNLVRVSRSAHMQKSAAFAAMRKEYFKSCTSLPWRCIAECLSPRGAPAGAAPVRRKAWEDIAKRHATLGLLLGDRAAWLHTCPGKKLCLWVAHALTNLGGVDVYIAPPPTAPAGRAGESSCGSYRDGSGVVSDDGDAVSYDTNYDADEGEVGGLQASRAWLEAQGGGAAGAGAAGGKKKKKKKSTRPPRVWGRCGGPRLAGGGGGRRRRRKVASFARFRKKKKMNNVLNSWGSAEERRQGGPRVGATVRVGSRGGVPSAPVRVQPCRKVSRKGTRHPAKK